MVNNPIENFRSWFPLTRQGHREVSFSDDGEEPTSTPMASRFNLGQPLVIDHQQLLGVATGVAGLGEDRLQ